VLAQLGPGTKITFKQVTLDFAVQKSQDVRQELKQNLKAVSLKTGNYIPK